MTIKRDFVLDPFLTLYLPLYELAGSSFMSKDAYGRLCTATGANLTLGGRRFDGVDDIITVPISPTLKASGPFSIVCWVKITSYQDGFAGIILNINGYSDFACRLMVRQSDLAPLAQVHIGGASQNVLGALTTSGVFNHLAYVYDGANEYWFTNRQQGTLYARTGTPNTGNTNIIIGKGAAAIYHLGGTIGELRIYNRALMPLEIQNDYLATKSSYR